MRISTDIQLASNLDADAYERGKPHIPMHAARPNSVFSCDTDLARLMHGQPVRESVSEILSQQMYT